MKKVKPFNTEDYRPFTLADLQTNQKEEIINFYADIMFAMHDQFRLAIIMYLRRHHATTIEDLLIEFQVHENDLLFQLKTLLRFGLIYIEVHNGIVLYFLLHRNFPTGMLVDIDKNPTYSVLPDNPIKWYQLYSFTISNAGRLN